MSRAAPRRLRPWLFWALLTAAFLLFLHLIGGILLPFVAGFAVAYFLDPLVDRLERRGLGRLAGTALVTLLFLAVVALFILLVGPLLVEQISDLIASLPDYAAKVRDYALGLMERWSLVTGVDLKTRLTEAIRGSTEGMAGTLAELLSSLLAGSLALVNILSLVLITPVVAFYLLLEWDRIVTKVDSWLPRSQLATWRQLFSDMDRVLAGFLRGQATVCGIMAIYYATVLSLAGLNFGVVIGIAAGIMTFVPFLGTFVGLLLTGSFALLQYDTIGPVLLMLGLYGIGQTVESYLITPRLVGRMIGLHDVWMIFAVLAGGALGGLWGVLVAVPVAGCLGVLVRFVLARYMASPYYNGGDAA